MEKTLIDRIASGEIHTLELIERLRTFERKTIEEFIVELDLESVIRNDGTIEGKRIANYIQNVINAISRELKVPDQWSLYEQGYDRAAQKPEQAKTDLPNELNTDEAQKYFQRAETAGYIDGHNWLKKQVQLGYFCSKVYSTPRPINALEDYFGVKKLSASITQAETEPKRRDVIKWRKAMDDEIFYD